jgi:hypothetical protein
MVGGHWGYDPGIQKASDAVWSAFTTYNTSKGTEPTVEVMMAAIAEYEALPEFIRQAIESGKGAHKATLQSVAARDELRYGSVREDVQGDLWIELERLQELVNKAYSANHKVRAAFAAALVRKGDDRRIT